MFLFLILFLKKRRRQFIFYSVFFCGKKFASMDAQNSNDPFHPFSLSLSLSLSLSPSLPLASAAHLEKCSTRLRLPSSENELVHDLRLSELSMSQWSNSILMSYTNPILLKSSDCCAQYLWLAVDLLINSARIKFVVLLKLHFKASI